MRCEVLRTLFLWANKPSFNGRSPCYCSNTRYALHLQGTHAQCTRKGADMLTGTSAAPAGPKSNSSSIKGGGIKSFLYFQATLFKNIDLNMNAPLVAFFTVCIMRRITLKQECNMDLPTLRLRQSSCMYIFASKWEASSWNNSQGPRSWLQRQVKHSGPHNRISLLQPHSIIDFSPDLWHHLFLIRATCQHYSEKVKYNLGAETRKKRG